MLMSGEIDALMSPEPRKSMMAEPHRFRRLFRDSPAEELKFFRTDGYFPVMHLMVAKRELLEQNPQLGRDVIDLFERAKHAAYEFYDDSDYSLIVWSRNHYEKQRELLGMDPWVNGFKANRKDLARFLEYAHDQRLTKTLMQPEELFHSSTWET
jgi:4,5-dihydroxyphthalate decarboxylase